MFWRRANRHAASWAPKKIRLWVLPYEGVLLEDARFVDEKVAMIVVHAGRGIGGFFPFNVLIPVF